MRAHSIKPFIIFNKMITTSKIKTIVFDLGNVLLPFDYSRAVNKINSIKNGYGDILIKYLKDNYSLHRKFEKGELTDEEFCYPVLKAIDFIIDANQFRRIYSNIFSMNEEVVSLLPKLKMNYKLVLLSNTNVIHQKYGYEQLEFFKHFDKLILSHEVGAVKPEAEIYRCVEEFTFCKPEEHIFIDDIPEYVQAAITRGWEGIVFKNASQLVEELRTKNILID